MAGNYKNTQQSKAKWLFKILVWEGWEFWLEDEAILTIYSVYKVVWHLFVTKDECFTTPNQYSCSYFLNIKNT